MKTLQTFLFWDPNVMGNKELEIMVVKSSFSEVCYQLQLRGYEVFTSEDQKYGKPGTIIIRSDGRRDDITRDFREAAGDLARVYEPGRHYVERS